MLAASAAWRGECPQSSLRLCYVRKYAEVPLVECKICAGQCLYWAVARSVKSLEFLGLANFGLKECAMKRREVLKSCLVAGVSLKGMAYAAAQTADGGGFGEDRASWVGMLDRICGPLFAALSARRLKELMPVEAAAGQEAARRKTTHLEALGRALAGMAPWLEHGATAGKEGEARARYCGMARAAIAAAVDQSSPDYMNFGVDPAEYCGCGVSCAGDRAGSERVAREAAERGAGAACRCDAGNAWTDAAV